MELPPNLIQEVKSGNVILFLGAGAAYGATSDSGERYCQIKIIFAIL